MKLNFNFVSQSIQGQVLSQVSDSLSGYCVDSRSAQMPGALFIPLVGDKYDAHDFVSQAVAAGASAVLVHKWRDEWNSLKGQCGFIQVDDTLKALNRLAQAWRQKFKGKVIALSGSNGKTTSKDFLVQLLSSQAQVQGSRGSFNNHWGVPFTLLDTDPSVDFCVLEMGMNHSGELTHLVQLAQPDVVGLTNVGRAHVGNFADGVEGVARAKEEIYLASPQKCLRVFNLDNPWTAQMYARYRQGPCVSFSQKDFSADVYLRIKEKTLQGYQLEGQIGGVLGQGPVSFWGPQNIENLCLALALAYAGGVKPETLWPQLSRCHTGWGRNQWLHTQSGAQVLFDAYNANPESFAQLMFNLQESWQADHNYHAIFGEMYELGGDASGEHHQLGKRAAQLSWHSAVFIGPSGQDFLAGWQSTGNAISPMILNSYEESLAFDLNTMLDPKSLIIVKGSRGGALERLVERLKPEDFPSKN